MGKGTFTGTADGTTVAVVADAHRDSITIQLINKTAPIYLGFGEAAVDAQGIKLIEIGDVVTVRAHLARGKIYAIGNGGICTWQTGDLTYIPNYSS